MLPHSRSYMVREDEYNSHTNSLDNLVSLIRHWHYHQTSLTITPPQQFQVWDRLVLLIETLPFAPLSAVVIALNINMAFQYPVMI
ncbi:hypothetical protein Dda_7056 [Drechslerella dactyloides]|uniref:Uncharacterized protein n=1 Tax=Drechslerella dactyloides TaxID=74499 RepID=A0AAD6IU93_DREDA|nr:hypothetical protein Dda_7056 [Drechslerella dactyloides]